MEEMYREQSRMLVCVDRTLERFRGADVEVLAGPVRDAFIGDVAQQCVPEPEPARSVGHQENLTLERGFKMTGMAVCIELQNGTPSIHVDSSQAASGIIGFSPACLRQERDV